MAVKYTRFEKARDKSIIDYLQLVGIKLTKQGSKHWCSSPFTDDSKWSFAVYPNNTFYDWSSGKGGDLIDLVSELEGVSKGTAVDTILGNNYKEYIPVKVDTRKKPFRLETYLVDKKDKSYKLIGEYAKERGFENFRAGKWMFNVNGEWINVPALAFVHTDETGKVIGVKLRAIEEERQKLEIQHNRILPKFTLRGDAGWFRLENRIEHSFKETILYVMESETSATSLYQYCKQEGIPAVILCFGGVTNHIPPIPEELQSLRKYLIIDYDGNEGKFKERIKKIALENVEPLKLILDKGEDINSLYCNNQMYKISYLLKQ